MNIKMKQLKKWILHSRLKLLFPVYTFEAVLLIIIIVVSFIIQIITGNHNEAIYSMERPGYEEGDKEVTLYYDSEEAGSNSVQVSIEAIEPTQEEAEAYTDKLMEELKMNLKKHLSKQIFDGPLNLSLNVGQCRVEYHYFPAYRINEDGWIHYKAKESDKDTFQITIEIIMDYAGVHKTDKLTVDIHEDQFSKQYIQQYHKHYIEQIVYQLDKVSEETSIQLPEEYTFYLDENNNNIGHMILLGILMIVALIILSHYESQTKKLVDQKDRKIQLTYFINNFLLLYQTGMTIPKCFHLSLKNRMETIQKDSKLNIELKKIEHALSQGQSFTELLDPFGESFDSIECKRFIRLIVQNLKQGDEYLYQQLDQMTANMWDERIRSARKESEKASSKLVFPMLLIFIVILIISIVPTLIEVKTIL